MTMKAWEPDDEGKWPIPPAYLVVVGLVSMAATVAAVRLLEWLW